MSIETFETEQFQHCQEIPMEKTEKKPFYITTTLPYVNGRPHIGFALEVVQADVITRFHRMLGEEVIFNIGTDEHGVKIWEKAQEEQLTAQAYCDRMTEPFRELKSLLSLGFTHFIRTTDPGHVAAAQAFWKRCLAAGDIYKKNYQMKYCVGCELEKTDSELVDGRCSDHPNRDIELVEEENYFFRFSRFQEPLLALYSDRPDFVIPTKRHHEIRAFVERGLQDFSISRQAHKMPWGIPVPDDDEHVMYVWFDALVSYIATLGWPACAEGVAVSPAHRCGEDSVSECVFGKFWPGVQMAGKDNLRQQSAMWQAMLLSAGLPPSKQILIHGHIMSGGQKMSKSVGNVIAPEALVARFGLDGTRYLLLSAAAFGEDMDMTLERLTEKYHADLANGLGNLTSRLIKLSERLGSSPDEQVVAGQPFPEALTTWLSQYQITEALEWIMGRTRVLDREIAEQKPWVLAKTDPVAFAICMEGFLTELAFIAQCLSPFLPDTSASIQVALRERKSDILFQRV